MSAEPREFDASGYAATGGPQPWPTITFRTNGRDAYMESERRTFERLGDDWVDTTGGGLAYVVPKFRIDPSAIKVEFTRGDEAGSTPWTTSTSAPSKPGAPRVQLR